MTKDLENTIKNITCILVDDEKIAIERMEALLKKISNVKIEGKTCSSVIAIKMIIEKAPDIVFLDVELDDKSGFDIIHEVRNKNIFPTFIFVTGYNQYAVKAIKEQAFDFLIKPVDIDELHVALQRYRQHKKEKNKLELTFKLKQLFQLTNREIEIISLIAQGNTSKKISEILFISKKTVDTHRRNILAKTGKKSIAELIYSCEHLL